MRVAVAGTLPSATNYLTIANSAHGQTLRVVADLEHLPLRPNWGCSAVASASDLEVGCKSLPVALHDLHRALAVDADLRLTVGPRTSDLEVLEAIIEGAGFVGQHHAASRLCADDAGSDVVYELRRVRTLADTVGPDMSVLVVGLNPSLRAADCGVGFIGPSNRFWKAAVASGLITVPRQPRRALVVDHVGMTDLVKRATTRASEVRAREYRDGLVRLDLMVGLLQPRIVCVVGLTGWRAATGGNEGAGFSEVRVGGRPVYVMPNPSGLNAHTNHDDLVGHFRAVLSPNPGFTC